MAERMKTGDGAVRDCRQCYGSGECFQCSGRGRIPSDLGGKESCHSCGGGGKCILCSGRGEVAQPLDAFLPASRPLNLVR